MIPERVFTDGLRVVRLKTAKSLEEITALGSPIDVAVREGERRQREKMERLRKKLPFTDESITIR